VEVSEETQDGLVGKGYHVARLFFKYLFDYSIPLATKEQWSPVRSIVSLVLAPFISMGSYGRSYIIHLVVDSFEQTLLAVPFAVWFSLPAVLLLCHSAICIIRRNSPSSSTIFYSVYSFLVVVCWITMICSVLINLLELLQLLTNINPVFLGLTVLAWANCIGGRVSAT
jgi:Ca2+/Na+ antiporter